MLPSKHSPQNPEATDIGKILEHEQPQEMLSYVEGNSFDFVIKHGSNSILIKPSASWLEGGLDKVSADVVFLSTAQLGLQNHEFMQTYYDQTVAKVNPKLVVPIHWDNFWLPLSKHLLPMSNADTTNSFNYIISRTKTDNIQFGIMQGTESLMLFDQPKQ